MIKKLSEYKITSRDGSFINVECNTKIINTLVRKINELVDAVNELQESQNTYWTDIAELKKELLTHTKIAQGFKNLQDHRPNMVMDDPFGPHPNIYEQGRQADPYAEQRKWIGKLCWFWNNDNEPDTCFGVLTGLFDEADRPFERSIGQQLYRYCEPVKPDDDIIYKGGNNE